jgi:hypothetical protein
MVGITFLSQAQSAGLTVEVNSGKLVIRGPKKHAMLAQSLLAHKQAILDELAAAELAAERQAIQEVEREAEALQQLHAENYGDDDPPEVLDDLGPACTCGSLMFWWDAAERQRCLLCDPPLQSERLFELAERIQQQTKRYRPTKRRR